MAFHAQLGAVATAGTMLSTSPRVPTPRTSRNSRTARPTLLQSIGYRGLLDSFPPKITIEDAQHDHSLDHR